MVTPRSLARDGSISPGEVWCAVPRNPRHVTYTRDAERRCERCGCRLARDQRASACTPCQYTTNREER